MEQATWLLTFLRELERQVHPPIGQHHSLTFAQFGSEFEGWEDKLCLTIQRANGSDKFFIDDSDLLPDPRHSAVKVAHEIHGSPVEALPAAGVRDAVPALPVQPPKPIPLPFALGGELAPGRFYLVGEHCCGYWMHPRTAAAFRLFTRTTHTYSEGAD